MNPLLLAILLLPPALIAFLCVCQLPAFLICRFERRSVWPYERRANSPANQSERPSDNPYAAPTRPPTDSIPLTAFAISQLRRGVELGFVPIASTADQNKKLVQVRYEFLISPDQKILAIVACGKVASIPVRTVYMKSQLQSGDFFTTLGAHAACLHDLNQGRTEMVVYNASFETMLGYHQQRCDVLGSQVKPFEAQTALDTYYRYRVAYYQDHEKRGLIRYIDSNRKEFRLTWKGAFLFVFYGTVRQIRRSIYPDRFLKEPMLARLPRNAAM